MTTTTNPTYAFCVPNTAEGLAFIKAARKYANYGHIERTRIRANGPRKAHALADGRGARGYDQDLPRKYATSLRLYLDFDRSAQRDYTFGQYNRANQAEQAARVLSARVDEMRVQLGAAQAIAAARHSACEVLEAERTANRLRLLASEAELCRIPAWVRRFFNTFNR